MSKTADRDNPFANTRDSLDLAKIDSGVRYYGSLVLQVLAQHLESKICSHESGLRMRNTRFGWTNLEEFLHTMAGETKSEQP